MSTPSILISGASIAGPTLASWLGAAGWDVTVIERFDQLRDEGQNIDIRGTGREVLRRMGLEDVVRAAHTHETGLDFVDERGRPVARIAAGTDDTSGGTAELEILRGRLSRILHDHSSTDAAYVFGDQITALHDDGHGVDVEFRHGPARRFDAVVIAEGLRSRTRSLVIRDVRLRELGLYSAYFTIPRTDADDNRWRWLIADRGRGVTLRPDDVGTIRASLNMHSATRGLDRLDRADIVTILRATFADIGWETPGSSTPSTTARCTSNRSVRLGSRAGAAAGSPCSGTPPTAPRRSAVWGRPWPSPAPTSWPVSSPATPIRRPRSPATRRSCARSPSGPSNSGPGSPTCSTPAPGCSARWSGPDYGRPPAPWPTGS